MEKAQDIKRGDGRREDLRLSHAFVGTLSAVYSGMWVFECVLEKLEPVLDREDELNKTERVLDTVEDWGKRLAAGDPLLHIEARPLLDDDGSRAWRLLQVAESRLRALIGELTESSDLEFLMQEPLARNIRVAALCEVAHAQRAMLLGMVTQAEALGSSEQAEILRGGVLAAENTIVRAQSMCDRLQAAGTEPSVQLVEELLDQSLLLPARVAQRVVDIGRVFSLYTGVFDYEDAGIPDAQQEIWADEGFNPHDAGRWFAAGFSPCTSRDWIDSGTDDALVAAGFQWRGFTPAEASRWLEHYIDGRNAAAWIVAGCEAEDASEWIALGIRDPLAMAAMPSSMREM